MAHGFTQTGRVWGTLDTDLARDHRLVLVDLPGHGGSSAVTTSLGEGAALLAETGGVAAYLGYSMGARYCVRLALDHPEVVERLVLISGTAGIDTDADRHLRRRSDEALADRLDPPPGSATEAQPVADFVRAWLEAPLFAGIGEDAAGIDRRAANTGVGLASSLRLAGTGTQEPLWDRLGDLSMPVLVVTGARDGKFTALGRRMVDAIGPNSRQVVVDGAGHAPHLQYPAEVAALVRSFLAEPVAD
jgi:2-succinyl-6-hydroxy-2,4-cyclohexadiene-1-carboxylate synthase